MLGSHSGELEPAVADRYHKYESGAFVGRCSKTSNWRDDGFISEFKNMMMAFTPSVTDQNTKYVKGDTFVLTRDVGAHNLFHGDCNLPLLRIKFMLELHNYYQAQAADRFLLCKDCWLPQIASYCVKTVGCSRDV